MVSFHSDVVSSLIHLQLKQWRHQVTDRKHTQLSPSQIVTPLPHHHTFVTHCSHLYMEEVTPLAPSSRQHQTTERCPVFKNQNPISKILHCSHQLLTYKPGKTPKVVHQKPTHTDHYLMFESHHPVNTNVGNQDPATSGRKHFC